MVTKDSNPPQAAEFSPVPQHDSMKTSGNEINQRMVGRSIRELTILFFSWKSLLLLVACASPGPGYDTSSQLLLDHFGPSQDSPLPNVIVHLVMRLTRWDAIYFASLSTRGHVHEQEWAFSWAQARITSGVARVLFSSIPFSPLVKHALAGILLSIISHLFAVFALYHLTLQLTPGTQSIKRHVAFTAACLHVISPAGLFLSAPYGESTFAFFNFTGMLSYAIALRQRISHPAGRPTHELFFTVAAGLWFGAAAMIRSNGLLSGIIFAWDAIEAITKPSETLQNLKNVARFAATITAGTLVGLGFAAPQVVAYMEYCTAGNTRPWCSRLPPSIYSWVQEHYWEVGFLRYWTLNNLPLFLLAGPMLGMLLFTASVALRSPEQLVPGSNSPPDTEILKRLLRRFALPQLTLAVMAATSFHVQIINRISSGYPVWNIILALAMIKGDGGSESKAGQTNRLLKTRYLQWAVRGMVIYAVVQGGLYASFLPPA